MSFFSISPFHHYCQRHHYSSSTLKAFSLFPTFIFPDLYPFPLVYWHVFLFFSKTIELVTLGLDTWFGEVVYVYLCLHTCAAFGCERYLETVWMPKCLNFHKAWIFSIHGGIKYVKSVLFWNLWWAYVTPPSDFGPSVFGLNVFIFSFLFF